jgi:hypothetical protein
MHKYLKNMNTPRYCMGITNAQCTANLTADGKNLDALFPSQIMFIELHSKYSEIHVGLHITWTLK